MKNVQTYIRSVLLPELLIEFCLKPSEFYFLLTVVHLHSKCKKASLHCTQRVKFVLICFMLDTQMTVFLTFCV